MQEIQLTGQVVLDLFHKPLVVKILREHERQSKPYHRHHHHHQQQHLVHPSTGQPVGYKREHHSRST
jgi:hypothetical protein